MGSFIPASVDVSVIQAILASQPNGYLQTSLLRLAVVVTVALLALAVAAAALRAGASLDVSKVDAILSKVKCS